MPAPPHHPSHEKTIPRLRDADLEEIRAELDGKKLEHFRVAAQHIPAAARDSAYAQGYLEGLFSLDEADVVPVPIKSQFGWHAIVVKEIVPADVKTEAEARDILRDELMRQARVRHVREFVARLRKDTPVEIVPSAREQLAGIEP